VFSLQLVGLLGSIHAGAGLIQWGRERGAGMQELACFKLSRRVMALVWSIGVGVHGPIEDCVFLMVAA
jgi:hypothetical protein